MAELKVRIQALFRWTSKLTAIGVKELEGVNERHTTTIVLFLGGTALGIEMSYPLKRFQRRAVTVVH